MIELSKITPLGVGSHRKCYVHPEHPDRCIKIVYDTSPRAAKEIVREQQYYRHLARTLKDWSGIPRYFGEVETDQGTGYVFELVTDYDGSTSRTLDEVMGEAQTPEDAAYAVACIRDLRRYIRENLIVTLELHAYNVMCRRISADRTVPVLCDNLGERARIPLSFWIAPLCRARQKKRWEKFLTNKAVKEFTAKFRIDPASL